MSEYEYPNARFVGDVRIENPRMNLKKVRPFLWVMFVLSKLKRLKVVGAENIPPNEPLNGYCAPHTEYRDPLFLQYAIAKGAHRSSRMAGADYVLNLEIPQDPVDLAERGKKPYPLYMRRINKWIAEIGDPIPFNRDPDHFEDNLPPILETIDSGQIFLIAFQDRRRPANMRNEAKTGAAAIALARPNVPNLPIGIIGMEGIGPLTISFGTPFKVSDILAEDFITSSPTKALALVHYEMLIRMQQLLPEEIADNLLKPGQTWEKIAKRLAK
jgi:1-acyl-sn-glycerol-3-phosphate acyltransferase